MRLSQENPCRELIWQVFLTHYIAGFYILAIQLTFNTTVEVTLQSHLFLFPAKKDAFPGCFCLLSLVFYEKEDIDCYVLVFLEKNTVNSINSVW